MKTKSNMKTKTNFQKAAMRTAAVVVSFVLVSFTVSAQDFWKKLLTNSTFNEIAMAMVEASQHEKLPQHSEIGNADWFDFDRAFDPELELEGWMTSESYFEVSTFPTSNEEVFGLINPNFNLHINEEPLSIENWMTSADFWKM
jgi:predicted naringenin-chalcone synthase